MEDNDHLRSLKALTADDAVWEGFNPSAWRAIPPEDKVVKIAESSFATQDQNEAADYASDDSAPMVLNHHKLTKAERAKYGISVDRTRQHLVEDQEIPRNRPLEKLEKVKWKQTGLAMGDVSSEGDVFVAWRLVTSYPDMFVGKVNGSRAAPFFTVKALHQKCDWDLYYIYAPPQMNIDKAVILVPTYQFQHVLDAVNAKLDTQLTIPPGRNEGRFKMTFGFGNTPRPRFLGRSSNGASFRKLVKSTPGPHQDDDISKVAQADLDNFQHLIARTRADRKSRKRSDRNRSKRIASHKAWGQSIKRVQRYLGLRQRVVAAEIADGVDKPAVLDLSEPTSVKPENSVMFLAVDVEAWEQNQNLVTEVGIATLDTTEIQNIAPGNGGQNWFPYIRARHFRVKENSWAVNRRYVHGCPERFSFGRSEFVRQAQIEPILKQLVEGATLTDPVDGMTKQRPVVLVFHEAASDIKYLKLLAYHVEAVRNVLEVVDTRMMHQYLVRSNDSASLASVLNHLSIPYRHLHNAGNDAVYTLQAMVGLAVAKRLKSLEKVAAKATQTHIPYNEFKHGEGEGWTSNEDDDGGDPDDSFRSVFSSENEGAIW
ncbi:hypothetical protein C8A03DRAFT_34641 [Achaetomium macrosporum]|uniref:Gfd2/YDR514C-like C-terminal domain-containing protein n=1 Tax=Achaetomium macrosporum TaxID=79813 RepID=A0AAN7HES3_9PEZI|nr:hypothetical protein C8A03DRAFT_34641 [Achaetomium macrosporum]